MQTIAPYLLATRRRAELWPEIAEACWHDEREPPAQRWNPRPGTLSDVDAAHFHFRGGQAVRPGHPESFGEGLCRVHAAMDLLQEMAGRTDHLVLMVTHGHFIRELLNVILDTRRPIHVAQSNCGMTLMSHQGGWGMEFCNRVIEPR